MNDNVKRQFLLAALLCGETIPNENDDENPDPLWSFLSNFPQFGTPAFREMEGLGFVKQVSNESDWVVTDKGKEFLK